MRSWSTTLTAGIALALLPAFGAAQGMGFGGGMMGGGFGTAGAGGPGMLTVADDGSLLVTDMGAATMMGGGSGTTIDRELVSISPDGTERWRVSFDAGVPMMAVTSGDLVVLTLADEEWIGTGATGDMGWGYGGGGGGMMGGGKVAQSAQADSVTLVALDLNTGAERWRTQIDGGMGMLPQISPDGSRVYLTVHELNTSGIGQGPMNQGGAPGAGLLMSTSVVAVNAATGATMWTLPLDGAQ